MSDKPSLSRFLRAHSSGNAELSPSQSVSVAGSSRDHRSPWRDQTRLMSLHLQQARWPSTVTSRTRRTSSTEWSTSCFLRCVRTFHGRRLEERVARPWDLRPSPRSSTTPWAAGLMESRLHPGYASGVHHNATMGRLREAGFPFREAAARLQPAGRLYVRVRPPGADDPVRHSGGVRGGG